MIKNITLNCSSSDALSQEYFEVAKEVGKYIGENGYTLIWGGADVGLMGEVARSTQKNGGKAVGIIPKHLEKEKILYKDADEIFITEDMTERKKVMSDKADAFIVLIGGFGTLEEILEILTWKQLHLHNKPIVFLNTKGFFDDLIRLFEKMYAEKVAKEEYRQMYFVTESVEEAFAYLKNYQPIALPKKWFDKKNL
jgi:uncharacterized protein (TIGR00730 family)